MTKRSLVLTTIVVLAGAVLFGRYVLAPRTGSPISAGEQSPTPDKAAEAAGRAMTFTQPKALSE